MRRNTDDSLGLNHYDRLVFFQVFFSGSLLLIDHLVIVGYDFEGSDRLPLRE